MTVENSMVDARNTRCVRVKESSPESVWTTVALSVLCALLAVCLVQLNASLNTHVVRIVSAEAKFQEQFRNCTIRILSAPSNNYF